MLKLVPTVKEMRYKEHRLREIDMMQQTEPIGQGRGTKDVDEQAQNEDDDI